MLDADRLSELPGNGREVLNLLERQRFIAIWQRPDHESLLLNHFDGHDHDRPPQGKSMIALKKFWPDYHKNISATDLQRKFELKDVMRAAQINSELMGLLNLVGLRHDMA